MSDANNKIYLYKARDADVVAILRRGLRRQDWHLMKWTFESIDLSTLRVSRGLTDSADLSTLRVSRGQWLMGKWMTPANLCISPDGKFFGYNYSIYGKGGYECYGVVSRLPEFTAVAVGDDWPGAWDLVRFNADGSLSERMYDHQSWRLKGVAEDLKIEPRAGKLAPTGFIHPSDSWVDPLGRRITVDGYQILADGVCILDTTDYVFEEVAPV